MRISRAFPGKYLRASDVQGGMTCTIAMVTMEQVNRDEQKPIVYFKEVQQGLVLNKTNGFRLAESLGDETEEWSGRQVTLDTEWVTVRGQEVQAIRAHVDGAFMAEHRPPTAKESAAAAQKPLDDLDDEIPF
jgi:hypothetical protein